MWGILMGAFHAASLLSRLLKNLSKSKDPLASVWGPTQAPSASFLRCQSLAGVCPGWFYPTGHAPLTEERWQFPSKPFKETSPEICEQKKLLGRLSASLSAGCTLPAEGGPVRRRAPSGGNSSDRCCVAASWGQGTDFNQRFLHQFQEDLRRRCQDDLAVWAGASVGVSPC